MKQYECKYISRNNKQNRRNEKRRYRNFITQNCKLLEKPEILFYTKKDNIIKGYLEIRNKNFYFEIRINKLANEKEYTISVSIGKMVIIKKLSWGDLNAYKSLQRSRNF